MVLRLCRKRMRRIFELSNLTTGPDMRAIPILLALIFASSTATAQSWKEYAYPADFFSVAFPADPKVETTTYQAADGRQVQARVYSVLQDGGVFRMTVADLPDPAIQENVVLDHAVRTLSQDSEIKVDIPHRISRVYGRQLSIAAPDGKYSSVAVFYHKRRLYQIEGTVLPSATTPTSDAIRFQQSLVFTDDATNR
jgi:hypothetical protein